MKKMYFAYLMYLIVVTLIVTAVSFSRYATVVEVSASVSVAKPVVRYVPVSGMFNGEPLGEVTEGITIEDVLPGDELVLEFNINNFDEDDQNQVLMKYRVSIAFDPAEPNLPLEYTLQPLGEYPSAGDGWVYMGFDGQITHSYILTVSWDESDDSPAFLGKEQRVQVIVDAQQVDAMN
jgi:hypothetical protein